MNRLMRAEGILNLLPIMQKSIIKPIIKLLGPTAVLASFLLQAACFAQAQLPDTVYQSALPLYADTVAAPLDPVQADSGSFSTCTWQKIVFTGKSERVPGLLFLPTGATETAPVPCILLLHGLGGSKEQLIPLARFLASIGYASWAIDDAGSGERQLAPGKGLPAYSSLDELKTGVVSLTAETIVDLRRGIDYIDTRPEVRHDRIGLMGFSLGALLGAVLGGVESRVSAVMLVSGGGNLGEIMVEEAKANLAFGKLYPALLSSADPVALEESLAQIDPINFVGHIAPRPLLMEHGRLDKIIPPDAAQALYDAAKQPKQIDWYPNAGHIPPPFELYSALSIFLDKYLPLPGR